MSASSGKGSHGGRFRAHRRPLQHTGCMRTIKLAVIPGDGIGKEVVPEGLKVLTKVLEGSDLELETTQFDLGADRWHRTGDTLTDEDLEAIRGNDVILLGAVGDPSVPPVSLTRSALKLRFALDHYVNLRPSKYYEGVASPLRIPDDTQTSLLSVKARRASTVATAVPSASAPRTRSQPRFQSTLLSVLSALYATRLKRPTLGLVKNLLWCTNTMSS